MREVPLPSAGGTLVEDVGWAAYIVAIRILRCSVCVDGCHRVVSGRRAVRRTLEIRGKSRTRGGKKHFWTSPGRLSENRGEGERKLGGRVRSCQVSTLSFCKERAFARVLGTSEQESNAKGIEIYTSRRFTAFKGEAEKCKFFAILNRFPFMAPF